MKQLMRPRRAARHPVERRRSRSVDPAVMAELAVIADLRRGETPASAT